VAHSLTDLGADIFLIENLLEPSLCSHLLEVANCCEFRSPPSGSSLQGELRSNEVLPFNSPNPLLASTAPLVLNQVSEIRELLSRRYDVTFSYAELYSIERSRPGQGYKRHSDGLILRNRYEELAGGIPARDTVILGYLNEDFAGGEVLFRRQNVKVKPSIGSAIAFPACYTHPYQLLPVLQGVQYIFLAWLMR
jgi:prolyl 4-hydroxylase